MRKKKILFAVQELYPPIRGAEKSSLTLLRELNEEKYEIYAFCIGIENQQLLKSKAEKALAQLDTN